ncbi:MAG: AAA family ATPase [Deltaproteobacteria bacterium]|nr:AAA family ATPase [Deltaproteobacteria bacterium]
MMARTSPTKGVLPPVIQAMLKPEFYPHPVPFVELKQTHLSYVLLAGEFAYKVRKAVRFAFIDCSSVARRRALSESEVELNRRLSPDVYLAVIAICQTDGQIVFDESSETRDAVEFAVKMRRLQEERRLDFLVKRRIVAASDIRVIANTIRDFHAITPNTRSWDYGAAGNIWKMVIGNLVEIEQLVPPEPVLKKVAQIETYSRRYIAAHWELLNARAHQGHVREGHGDLRADAVYLTSNGIRIIDCLEFDERLRYGDIANEVAFLAMDIDRLGRRDLARQLIEYFADDPDAAVLIPFYKSYRATVRAKVELLRSRQPDSGAEEKKAALANAGQLFDLALEYAAAPRALLIVCGASGTGKSTLAAALSQHLGLTVFSSDVIRKGLAGIAQNNSAAAPYNQGIYAAEFTAHVYDSLIVAARKVLHTRKGVILDATFGKRNQRQLLIDAMEGTGMKPLFVECRADQDVIIRRLRQQEKDSQRVSDATVGIYLSQVKEFDPLDEIPPALHEIVDTADDLTEIILRIERRIYLTQY